MDDQEHWTRGADTAQVILAFLQADCRDSEYKKELLFLGQEINLPLDINCNGLREDPLDDGDLETDGHTSVCITDSVSDLHPLVDLQRPGNRADAAAIQQVAQELKAIADQLEQDAVAAAMQNLSSNIMRSPSEEWKDHLQLEVDRVMRQAANLNDLPQERVMVALSLTLVKQVCEQTPQLLRNLFNTVLQFIRSRLS